MNIRIGAVILILSSISALLVNAQHAGEGEQPPPFELSVSASTTGKTNGKYGDLRTGRYSLTKSSVALGYRSELGASGEAVARIEHQAYMIARNAATPLPKQMQRVWAGVDYLHHWSNDYFLFTELGGSFASTGNSLGSKGASVNGGLVFGRQWTPKFRFGVGVYVESYEKEVIPLIEMDYAATEKLHLFISYPRAGVSYEVSEGKTVFAGVECDFATFSYRKEQGDLRGAPADATKLFCQDIRALVGYRQVFCPRLEFETTVGSVVSQVFEYKRGSKNTGAKYEADQTPLAASMKVVCRF